MKGAFETGLVLIVGMFFLALGLNLVRIPYAYHEAKGYQEVIVNQIETYHRYDETVIDLIESFQAVCPSCFYEVNFNLDKRYQVVVNFPIKIPILNIEINGRVMTFTQPLY